jgi:PAS domain S-box-containing protein
MAAPRKKGESKSQHASNGMAETLVSQEFLAAIPDAIVAVDKDGTIIQINRQTEELFQYTREELLGQKIEVLVPERYRPDHHHYRDQFASEPKTRRMGAGLDLFGRRRDGTEFPVEISLSPVSTRDGILVLSAIRDVTDRKRVEEDLRRANEELNRKTTQEIGAYRGQLASIIDSSEDSIVSKDLDGIILSWNQGAEKLYGYSAEETIGQPISMLVPEGRPDEIPRILDRIRGGESVEHYETVRVAKDGRHLEVSIRVSPIRDAAGTPVGASAISRDITAQKQAEEHIRQAQKMDAIGRLAGGLAHDFNNILGIISACSELLR